MKRVYCSMHQAWKPAVPDSLLHIARNTTRDQILTVLPLLITVSSRVVVCGAEGIGPATDATAHRISPITTVSPMTKQSCYPVPVLPSDQGCCNFLSSGKSWLYSPHSPWSTYRQTLSNQGVITTKKLYDTAICSHLDNSTTSTPIDNPWLPHLRYYTVILAQSCAPSYCTSWCLVSPSSICFSYDIALIHRDISWYFGTQQLAGLDSCTYQSSLHFQNSLVHRTFPNDA